MATIFRCDYFAAAEELGEVFLGSVPGEKPSVPPRSSIIALAPALRRLLGQALRTRGPLDSRLGRASVQERRKILRRLVVSLTVLEQKHLFGSSEKAHSLCGMQPGWVLRDPRRRACKEKNIQSYPTWIINGQRYTGVQPLDALAQLSNFQYQGRQTMIALSDCDKAASIALRESYGADSFFDSDRRTPIRPNIPAFAQQ